MKQLAKASLAFVVLLSLPIPFVLNAILAPLGLYMTLCGDDHRAHNKTKNIVFASYVVFFFIFAVFSNLYNFVKW